MIAVKPDLKPLASVSVLYVEDEASVREELGRFLRRRCGHLYLARDGVEGLELYAARKPDIVVTDIRMPRKTGIEMAEEIRRADPDTPIIVTTAHSEVEYLTRCIEIGVDRYVFKPTDPDDLVEALLKNARISVRRFEENTRALAAARSRSRELHRLRRAAEAANRAKSELVANTSHELRTPLGAILGFTRLAIEENRENRALVERLQVVVRNGEDLLSLIDDLLDFAKLEHDKLEIHPEPFRLVGLFADLEALLGPVAQRKRLSLDFEIENSLPEYLHTDLDSVRRILINLIGNAIKFTEAGSVSVAARAVDVEGDGEFRAAVELAVADTGIGVQANRVDRLFQPFSQADGSIRRKFGGTGLGLAISRRLARSLGGDLRFEPGVSGGSVFRLSIPLDSQKDAGLAANQANAAHGGADTSASSRSAEAMDVVPAGIDIQNVRLALRVLLAEDNPDNSALFQAILKNNDVEIVVVENGERAVRAGLAALDDGRPFDLIFMDMQMPVLDGYRAVRILREKAYPGKIVALTAHAMPGDRERCLNEGCDEYLTKPITRSSLIASILKLTARDGETRSPGERNRS